MIRTSILSACNLTTITTSKHIYQEIPTSNPLSDDIRSDIEIPQSEGCLSRFNNEVILLHKISPFLFLGFPGSEFLEDFFNDSIGVVEVCGRTGSLAMMTLVGRTVGHFFEEGGLWILKGKK